MVLVENNNRGWHSRRFLILALFSQTIGINSILTLTSDAITNGASGYILGCIVVFITIGIPLHYMEYIVGQFTTRDCINVWKIRPFLSHIGYFQIAYQITVMIYNHILASISFHYFLISFEHNIPYYMCGHWATKSCNILIYNYTVNEDCIKSKVSPRHCDSLYKTFPEYQYWRHYMLGNEKSFYIAWRCCLSSALLIIILFLSCLKGKQSVRWCITFSTIYPMIGYLIILIGSMQQKGVVRMYENALDTDFTTFFKNMQIASMTNQMLNGLNLGSGVSFNLASSTSFRSPCFANTVITLTVCLTFSVLAICISAMMACPYAYQYGIRPSDISKYPLSLVFVRKPRLIHEYDNYSLWLLLTYSCDTALAQNTNFILLLNFIDIISIRFTQLAKYPCLLCFILTLFLFLITIPLLGGFGARYIPLFRKYFNLAAVFLTMLELLVFIMWYGLSKICEDVHFMLGVPPSIYMKLGWSLSTIILGYGFFYDIYGRFIVKKETLSEKFIWWALICYLGLIILIMGINLLIAAFKKEFRNALRTDSTWGPSSDVLMRSRAMFSAQAMTKEYMYRQYHLQAGIYERQRRSNVRRTVPDS